MRKVRGRRFGNQVLRRSRSLLPAAASAAVLCAVPAFSQVSGSWLGVTFTTWTNVSQWTSNPLYPDGGGDAYFTLSGSTGLTVDVPITLSHMYFSPASVLRVIGQRNLSLVGDAEIYVERSFTNSPPTVSGIAGAAGLTKTGDGWLILANTNSSSYTGTTRVMGGQLLVRADPALGAPSTPVFIDGGATVRFQNFSTARNVTIGPGGGSIGGGVPGTGERGLPQRSTPRVGRGRPVPAGATPQLPPTPERLPTTFSKACPARRGGSGRGRTRPKRRK